MSAEYAALSKRHGARSVRGMEYTAIRQVHTPHSALHVSCSVLRTQYSVLPAAHRKPMRRAFTLVEMLTVISIGSVLMGIAISLLIVLLGAEQSGRTHAERSESLQRLADQFRRDVHAAVGEPVGTVDDAASKGTVPDVHAAVGEPAGTADDAVAKGKVPFSLARKSGPSPTRKSEQSPEVRHGCRLRLADDVSVRYAIGDGGISREEQTGSKDIRRELYALPKDSTAAIAVDRATSPSTLTLTIVPNDASLRSGHEIRIDAVLGRDHRFAEPRKEKK